MRKNVFKALSLLMIMTMLSSSISLFQISGNNEEKDSQKKKYIVITEDENDFQELSDEYEEFIANDYLKNNELQEENILITEMSAEEVSQIQKEEGVLLVEEDGIVTASKKENKDKTKATKKEKSKNDIDKEWNIKAVKGDDEEKGSIIASEDKIKVAIIDSGLDMTENIDVAGRINLIPGEEEVLPLFEDTTGHGTSIASIISANNDYEYSDVIGINDQVELYSAKVLDYTNSAPISRVIEGIYWAIEQNVDIINLSFGTTQNSEALYMAIRDAYDAGILIIAASGNSGGEIEYPAAYDEVMAVGSVDSTGTISDFCSTGEEMEVVAPGELIKTTGGFGGEIIVSGTSMAVPHVVGIASVLWQKDKTKPADFIRQLINESANYLGDENVYGNGLVDLSYALEIYDEFNDNYIPSVQDGELNFFENDAEIDSFSDMDYVEGLWYIDPNVTGENHESMAAYGANYYSLNSDQLYLIKLGATWPDRIWKGMTSYPYLHGYYANGNNYIASYSYVMKSAVNGSAIYSVSSIGGQKYLYPKIKTAFTNYGYPYNKYFVLGIAIHVGTDIFAHSVWYNGSRIKHVKPTKDSLYQADDTQYVRSRYYAALTLSRLSVLRLLGGSSNNHPALDLDYAYQYYNNTWYLYNYYSYFYQALSYS